MSPLTLNKEFFESFLKKHFRKIIYSLVIVLHAVALFTISFSLDALKEDKKDMSIFKMVDIKEYQKPKEEEKKQSDQVEIARQDKYVEDVVETDKQVKELDIDYLPMHKVEELPVLPFDLIKSRMVYPPLAKKQGIEGVVYLELYIDSLGRIRNIKILKDPGFGFGEAAINAINGLKGIPAKAKGIPVPIAYRYQIRFTLK